MQSCPNALVSMSEAVIHTMRAGGYLQKQIHDFNWSPAWASDIEQAEQAKGSGLQT